MAFPSLLIKSDKPEGCIHLYSELIPMSVLKQYSQWGNVLWRHNITAMTLSLPPPLCCELYLFRWKIPKSGSLAPAHRRIHWDTDNNITSNLPGHKHNAVHVKIFFMPFQPILRFVLAGIAVYSISSVQCVLCSPHCAFFVCCPFPSKHSVRNPAHTVQSIHFPTSRTLPPLSSGTVTVLNCTCLFPSWGTSYSAGPILCRFINALPSLKYNISIILPKLLPPGFPRLSSYWECIRGWLCITSTPFYQNGLQPDVSSRLAIQMFLHDFLRRFWLARKWSSPISGSVTFLIRGSSTACSVPSSTCSTRHMIFSLKRLFPDRFGLS